VHGSNSFLFLGDLEINAENEYSKKYKSFLDFDVLKVAHHGSKTSSSYEFLKYVTPEVSLISAGLNNNFSHLADEVLNMLGNFKSRLYRTELDKEVLYDLTKIELKL
jgi:competence protein ComEC